MRKPTIKSMGTLAFDDGSWVVTAGADVIMRLKRIFPRAEQHRLGIIRMKATIETAYEMIWIMERFPLDLSPADEKLLKKHARAHEQKILRLQSIQANLALPSLLKMAVTPREYQVYASALHLEQGALLLADEIGLGKTCSAITSFTDPRTLPCCVVVQTHVQTQWVEQIEKFMPTAKVHIIKTRAKYELPDADVYIISYAKLSDWTDILGEKIKSVVFDEVQELRHRASEKYKAAKLLCSEVKFRLGLSATPLYGYANEIWNIYDILAPDVLGSEYEFTREWCTTVNGKVTVTNPEALGNYLRANFLMLRRTRKEVGRVLPPVTKYIQTAEIDIPKFNEGVSAAEDLANIILNSTDFHEKGMAARQFDMKLRQATGVAKAPYCASLIRMLVEAGEKVVVGAWHRAVHDIFAKLLADLKVVFYTGEETPTEKDAAKKAFIEGDAQVIVISNRSGAGLDGLQYVSSCMVIAELDWAPKVLSQLIGRLDRDGQDTGVQVFVAVSEYGADPAMCEVLGVKNAQSAGIVELGETPTELTSIDPERIKKLARDFLAARGRKMSSAKEQADANQDSTPATTQSELRLSA